MLSLPSSVLAIIGWTTLAVFATGLGAVVTGTAQRVPQRWVGWSSAAAAGLMLGATYALYQFGLDRAPYIVSAGALVGLGLMYLVHAESRAGAGALQRNASSLTAPRGPMSAEAIHSAPEGIAIGAAAAAGGSFGMAFAIALALHNAAEGAVFGARAAPEKGRLRAAALAVVSKMVQPALALLTFLLIGQLPIVLPVSLGLSFGALLYLILADLLPTAYTHAGRTSIGVVVSLAAGVVGLLSATP